MEVFKFVFPKTLPVLIGYFVLGTAYGVLMEQEGYSLLLTFFASFLFFAGSAQYLAVGFLAANINPLYAFLAFFMVNARHIFYALSMIKPYKHIQSFWKKQYVIFSLTDEAFSILHDIEIPNHIQKEHVYVGLSMLQHAYWVFFSVFGYLFGRLVHVQVEGLDFVLTAFFIVIFINQWKKSTQYFPNIAGILVAIISLLLVGPDLFLIVSMFVIVLIYGLTHKNFSEVI
jgi:4-azaleucine resistance transporter AzlC